MVEATSKEVFFWFVVECCILQRLFTPNKNPKSAIV